MTHNFRGLKFTSSDASYNTFRGLKFSSTEAARNSFRGLRFSSQVGADATFRGLRFSFESETEGPSLRGIRFGFDPPETFHTFTNTDSFVARETDLDTPTDAFAALVTDNSITSDSYTAIQTSYAFDINGFVARTTDQSTSTDGFVSRITDESTPTDAFAAQVTENSITGDSYTAIQTDHSITADSFTELLSGGMQFSTPTDVFTALETEFSTTASGYVAQQQTEETPTDGFVSAQTDKTTSTDAFAASTKDYTFGANNYAATVINTSIAAEGYLARETTNAVNTDALAASETEQPLGATAFVVDKEASAILAYDIPTGYQTSVPNIDFLPAPGTVSGCASSDTESLLVWIQRTVLSTDLLIGRLDNHNLETNSEVVLSSLTGIEGVKVAFCRPLNKWVLVFKQNTNIYYSVYDRDLSASGPTDALITSSAPLSSPDNFDIGISGTRLLVLYTGEMKIVDLFSPSISSFTPANTSPTANKFAVDDLTGRFDILYVDGPDLKVDRYQLLGPGPVGPTSILTVSSGDPGLDTQQADILGRQGVDGFVVCWSTEDADDNIRYRIFDGAAGFLFAARTIPGTGQIDSFGKNLFATITDKVAPSSRTYCFALKVSDSGPQRTPSILWIKVDNSELCMGVLGEIPTEEFIFAEPNRRSPTPIFYLNEFELRHAYKNGPEIAFETYVTTSALMGLWRIDRSASIFVNTGSTDDSDAQSILQSLYSTYAGGNRLIGTTGTADADYQSYRSVDPNAAPSFEDFLNPSIDEDSIFIGGPIISEVAQSIQDNANIVQEQITELGEEIGATDVRFVNTSPPANGYNLGTAAPGIQVTNSHGTFVLNRHSSSGNIIDYAFIMRLAVDTRSTQQTKSALYIAGINNIGTEAAAYCLANPLQFRLGTGSGIVVILTYPEPPTFNPGVDDYIPGSTGTISIAKLGDIDADDFEG